MVRELFEVQPINSPFNGEVVTVNDVMDDKMKVFCQQVSKSNCSSDEKAVDDCDDEENGLYYENVIRLMVRKFIEGSIK